MGEVEFGMLWVEKQGEGREVAGLEFMRTVW